MKTILLITCLVLIVTSDFQTYQIRNIYVNENENICSDSLQDRLDVIFSFQDLPTITKEVNPGTGCKFSIASNFWSISTSGLFVTNLDGLNFVFGVAIFRTNPYGIQKGAYANTTLYTKQAHYQQRDYTCQIQGDGLIQHFNEANKPKTASIKVKCNTNSFEEKKII